MKRHLANVHLVVDSESDESLMFLLETLIQRINKKPPGVSFPDVGVARLKVAKLSRVRPHGRAR